MSGATIFVVDDDLDALASLRLLLEAHGHTAETFRSATAFLAHDRSYGACVITDVRMPEMTGLALQWELARRGSTLPVIVVTGHGDVPIAIHAMKAGAVDFIEKPYTPEAILAAVARALAVDASAREATAASHRIERLTPRERDVLRHLVAGLSNKQIAFELQISTRTVEVHRAHIMDKLQARSLSDLVRLSLAASRRQ